MSSDMNSALAAALNQDSGTQQDEPKNDPKRLPKTCSLKIGLGVIAIVYAVLAVLCICVVVKHGHSWNGDANTLTWILAGIGVGFAILSRLLFAQCQDAGLQSSAREAIGRDGIPIENLHKMDIAVRGPFTNQFGKTASWQGYLYKFVLPAVAITTGAVIKKAFGIKTGSISTTVTGENTKTIAPTDVGTGIQGASFPGAIVYNITSNTASKMDPNQTSWTYMWADTVDPSGFQSVIYYLPNLPILVADGTSGYINYSAKTSTLTTEAQCTAGAIGLASDGISLNSDKNITISKSNGTAWIQVTTAANTTWSCSSDNGFTTGSISFASDENGNWNISRIDNPQPTQSEPFSVLSDKMDMIADIISDTLEAAATNSGWDWYLGTHLSTGYSIMLASTRLTFGAATLAFSGRPAPSDPEIITGEAFQPIQQVALFSNWALYIVLILFFIQCVVAVLHIFILGEFRIDFGILQIMEMTSAGARISDHSNVDLKGHCSRYRTDFVDHHKKVAVRTCEVGVGTDLHLALVKHTTNEVCQVEKDRKYL